MERYSIEFKENGKNNDQSEAEKVLGSMPSSEEHMANIQAEKGREQLVDPNNGGALLPTDQPNVLRNESSDNCYFVTENNEVVPLKSPINDGELTLTDRVGIMSSEYDDMLYKVTGQGQIIPLKSPINDGKLTITDRADIMSSESDDILYKVTEQGQIIPLKNPINGVSLIVSDDNLFEDPTTGQKFELDATGKLNLHLPGE